MFAENMHPEKMRKRAFVCFACDCECIFFEGDERIQIGTVLGNDDVYKMRAVRCRYEDDELQPLIGVLP